MKRITLALFAATLIFAACSNEKTEGDTAKDTDTKKEETADKKEKKEWIPIDSAKAMAAMMQNATPGEQHKMLAKSVGTWNADVTFWMGMGKPANNSKGTSVTNSILNGLYIESKFSGDMMGMPFNGVATTGYDLAAKEYVSTWMENMNSSPMIMRGTWDDAQKAIVSTGSQKDPTTGQECTLKQVFKIVDDNNQVMEMYGPDPQTGKEFKMVEIKYTRKK